MRALIHKAVKQFRDQDPHHIKPWIIVFTSSNFQLNWTNLTHCIQGAVAYNNQIIKDLGGMRFVKDTDKDILEIDLFIWCQVNEVEKKIYQMVHFVSSDSTLIKETEEISNKLTPYPSEKIMDRNSKTYA